MNIVERKLGEVRPYEKNPRRNDDAVQYVAESIRQFGFKVPLVIDHEGVIVAGHTRWKAAKKLGLKTVPCIIADDLTEEQVKAFRLADNKVSEKAEWDFDLLAGELDELIDFDMSVFGFEEVTTEAETEVVEDDFEAELPEEPKAKLGDIYQLGRHRLMCGDSTSITDVERLMHGEKADMVFTDPPYNIASDSKNFAADCSAAMDRLSKSEWDKNFVIEEALDCILPMIGENATVYVCTSHFLANNIWEWMRGWASHYSYCIWSKPNPMPSLAKRHWTWNSEIVCYATRGKHTFNFPEEGHALSVWTIPKKNGDTGHPTEKPVAVPHMAIAHSSKKGDVVLDLFGGSGSTLIASDQLGRTCYMMEYDPKYVDVIIDRWEKFTGQKAVLLNGNAETAETAV